MPICFQSLEVDSERQGNPSLRPLLNKIVHVPIRMAKTVEVENLKGTLFWGSVRFFIFIFFKKEINN